MATDKKHIAVYLAPEVEQALIAFCESKGLISKKGTMFSAGVNVALAQFFGIADTDTYVTVTEKGNTPSIAGNVPSASSNIPSKLSGNIPSASSNIPSKLSGNILNNTDNTGNTPSNIPSETLAVEVLPGKLRA